MNIKKFIAMAMLALVQAIGIQPAAAEPNRTFTYDRAGNTLSDSRSYTATYNLRGQLATITKAGVTPPTPTTPRDSGCARPAARGRRTR